MIEFRLFFGREFQPFQANSIVDAMSDTPAVETEDKPLFSVAEVEQFTEDDTTAGRAIGKMLSALFLYTVLAMALVIWWTHAAIDTDHGTETGQEVATEPAH